TCYSENSGNGFFQVEFKKLYENLTNPSLPAAEKDLRLEAFEEKLNVRCFKIETNIDLYGLFCVKLSDEKIFNEYTAYVENTLNLIALRMENNFQNQMLLDRKAQLESLVQERTSDLKTAVDKLHNEIQERKKMEKALACSEERLKLALDSASDAVWDWQVDTGQLFYSSRWYTMLGYDPYELPQEFETWKNLTHPDDVQSFVETVFRHFELAEPFEIELRMKTKEGGWRWILSRGKTVEKDDQGQATRMLGTHMDITERKSVENRLAESTERFTMLFDNMTSGVAIYEAVDGGEDFVFVDLNRAGLKMGSKNKEEIIGRRVTEIFPAVGDVGLLDVFRRVWQTGTSEELPLTRYRDGTVEAWVENFVFKLPSGLIVALYEDTLEKRLAEAERERLMSAIEQVDEVIVITDERGIIQYVNPAFEKITGYTPKEAIGNNPRILQSGEHDISFYKTLWNTILGEQTWEGEFVNRKKNGSLYNEKAVISPVLDTNGRIRNFVAVKKDITEELKIKEQLRQTQKMESIGSLAGGIAHDFNNILFPILGLSELLIEDFPPGSAEHDNLQEIMNAGKRGRDLVLQILAVGRRSDRQVIPVHFQMVLKEVLKLSRSTIPTSIEIHQDIADDCPMVQADPTQLHQIAMNLITNAYHAVEEIDGKIDVKLHPVNLAGNGAEILNLQPGHYAKLSVSDTGQGIAPDDMERVFDPYFTTKEQGKGTGLGLSVVYGIVKEYGGDIFVESKSGEGSTFHVHLPAIDKDSGEYEPEKHTTMPFGDESILLVDDDQTIADLEQQMLERLGYQVTACFGSSDALEIFRSDPDRFDLVLSDMTMPGMTGDELAREIKAIRFHLPVVICTGFSAKMDEQRAASIGINALLNKPVALEEMAQTLRSVLDQTRM
ncbi:MAG: PAS domain S-box protein, partial [Desulfobacteraceae bacterium]